MAEASLAEKLKGAILWLSAVLVPIFQFVPNTWMYWGPMSMPLISYFSSLAHLPHLFDELALLMFDFSFLTGWHGLEELAGVILVSGIVLVIRAAVIGGGVLFLYSLVHMLRQGSGLVRSGPYRWVRHPQYLGLIAMTAGITAGVIQRDPVWVWREHGVSIAGGWILVVWLLQTLAYLLLARIEDLHLRARYGGAHAQYVGRVPFIVP